MMFSCVKAVAESLQVSPIQVLDTQGVTLHTGLRGGQHPQIQVLITALGFPVFGKSSCNTEH
jgi:hypothetical protein